MTRAWYDDYSDGVQRWASVPDDNDPYYRHVVPLEDTQPHSTDYTDPGDCWCEPQTEHGEHVTVIVHNSGDMREFSEPDYKFKPQPGVSLQ